MALRSFFAIDSANLVVTSSSSAAIVGNPIINNSSTPDGTIFSFTSGGGTNITLDDTGGSANTFDDDNAANHVITDGGGIVANGTSVEAESLILVRALDGMGNPTGPTITLTVMSQNGVTGDVWGFASSQPLQNGVSYVKTGGSNIGSNAYTNFVACFGAGTEIRTDTGTTRVEDIAAGDMVWTIDSGFQPVRWAGITEVEATGPLAPVVFAAGAIGNDTELVVSQEHRIYLDNSAAELLFGQPKVLVAAKHLCGLPGVALRPGGTIRYAHIMFDTHQVVQSNGTLTESFYCSELSLSGVGRDQRNEILALFPALRNGTEIFGPTAALTLKANEASVLRAYIVNDRQTADRLTA